MERKAVSGMLLSLLLIGMLTFAFNIQRVKATQPKTWTVDDDGPADFHTIQEAINAANPGDAIFVAPGTYFATRYDSVAELVISKTISLLGQDPNTTILVGGIRIWNADNVRVSGFTINAFTWGWYWDYRPPSATLLIEHSNNAVVSNNFIMGNGIWFYTQFMPNVGLLYSNNCMLKGNTWMPYTLWEGVAGIFFRESTNNVIVANDFLPAITYNWRLEGGRGNLFYHNNFWRPGSYIWVGINLWDNGYPSGGNYWSDYTGLDLYSGPYQNETNSDGIGDTSYIIDENNRDRYPLMRPWVVYPKNAIEDLIRDVKDMNLQQGIENSLDAKLNTVLQSLEALNADNRNDAVAKLQSFMNEVEAQRGNKLTNEQADYLIPEAQGLINSIRG